MDDGILAAGDRRQTVTIEINTPTTSADGQKLESWAAVDWLVPTRKAQVLPRGGREARLWEQLRAEVDYLVRVVYDSQTRLIECHPASYRLRVAISGLSDRILNIESAVDVAGNRRTLDLRCTEVRV